MVAKKGYMAEDSSHRSIQGTYPAEHSYYTCMYIQLYTHVHTVPATQSQTVHISWNYRYSKTKHRRSSCKASPNICHNFPSFPLHYSYFMHNRQVGNILTYCYCRVLRELINMLQAILRAYDRQSQDRANTDCE